MLKFKIYIVSIFLIGSSFTLYAQNQEILNPLADEENKEDDFQSFFFEALKQKGIENYDLAIDALQKCLTIDNTRAVVFFELGKNYHAQRSFFESEDAFKKAIAIQPKNHWFYVALYESYVTQDRTEDITSQLQNMIKSSNEALAFNIAKALLSNTPKSIKVKLALYKFYLNTSKPERALPLIAVLLDSSDLSKASKEKVFKTVKNFADTHTEFQDYISELALKIEATNTPPNPVGALQSKDKIAVKHQYITILKDNPKDFETLKALAAIYLDLKDYDGALSTSQNALAYYPAQPIFYLISGKAQNQLNQYQAALEHLEMGLEFLIDNLDMESNFYEELSMSYKSLNNIKAAESFVKKAKALKTKP